MDFKDLLSRADEADYHDLLGRSVIRLVAALRGEGVSVERMRDITLTLHTPQALLTNKASRELLLSLLKPEEVVDLLRRLGEKPQADYDRQLARMRFTKGTAQMKILLAYFSLQELVEEPVVPKPDSFAISPKYGLFSHQLEAAREVGKKLQTAPYCTLLNMPTGSGKTRTAMHVICRYLAEHPSTCAIWLATSEELCDQAADEFERAWSFLGSGPRTVTRFWASHEPSMEDLPPGLVVASIQKLYARGSANLRFISRIGEQSSLIVFDEAHQSVAETYRAVTNALLARQDERRLLGLTATPGRSLLDMSEDQILADYFHGRRVGLHIQGYPSPIDYLIDNGYLAKPEFHAIEYAPDQETLTDRELAQISQMLDVPSSILKRLADDEIRNAKIVRTMESVCQRNNRVLLFAATVDHAEMLAGVLNGIGIHSRSVTSKQGSQPRRAAIDWYKTKEEGVRVLCNYGVLTTGFDAPATSAAIIARPTTSLVLFSQMVGRAIRGTLAGGNATAEIHTVVDASIPAFRDLVAAYSHWEDIWHES